MKKIITLFIILVILVIFKTNAIAQKQGQQLIDSLSAKLSITKEDTGKVFILNLIGREYTRINENKKSFDYFNNALALSKKLNYKKGEGNALHNLGYVNFTFNEIPEAIKNYEEAIRIRKEISDQNGLAATYSNIGTVFKDQGNYSEALKMSFAALKIYENLGDKDNIANTYNNIGLFYWTQMEYKEALNIYAKALKMLQETGDTESMNHPYNNMAGIYADMGNYPEGLKNDSLSLKIREKMGDKNLIADSYAGIGIIFQRTNKYNEAIINFNKALKLYTETGNDNAIPGILASFAEVNMAQKKFTEARSYFGKAMEYYKKSGDPAGYYYIFEDLAKTDSAAGNYKSALENYKLFVLYRDSSVNRDNTKKLVQTQMQYDFDKKEALTKAEQEKKDAIAIKELQKQKLVRNGFVGGFAVMLLFAGVFFTQRNKIKKGKKLSDELLLNILPSEVAEELKAKGSADARQFDDVTVMFTDFKGFTQISEKLSPSELVAEIHTCFKAFDNIISKHNIEKIKTIGDAYMCAGGLPVANKTNATDVVSAAIEIQQFILRHLQQRKSEGKEVFEIRIGIHTGPVVAGIVGVKKFAYDIWGDTVNIASRMESSGEAGKVNISGSTYELVKDKFKCEHRGKIQAKNKGEIDMYFVEGVS